jgi:hypothetical protein
MAVRTRVALINPALNAIRTEQLVVAAIAFHWFFVLSHYLVANATQNVVFDISDLIYIDYSALLYSVFCHLYSLRI